MSEFWKALNEKIQFKLFCQNAATKMNEFNQKHQITEKISNGFNNVVNKCKNVFTNEKQVEMKSNLNENENKEIQIDDDKKNEKVSLLKEDEPEPGCCTIL